jgi:hypothetical protein
MKRTLERELNSTWNCWKGNTWSQSRRSGLSLALLGVLPVWSVSENMLICSRLQGKKESQFTRPSQGAYRALHPTHLRTAYVCINFISWSLRSPSFIQCIPKTSTYLTAKFHLLLPCRNTVKPLKYQKWCIKVFQPIWISRQPLCCNGTHQYLSCIKWYATIQLWLAK